MSNTFGEYVKRKRTELDLSLRSFGEKCGLSHTHIDSIEKGYDFRTGKKVSITNETTNKIASALGVDSSALYLLSLYSDSDKFNFYYDSNEADEIRGKCDTTLKSSSATIEEKVCAAVLILQTYFSRSITHSEFKNHISFNEYAAALLGQAQFKERFGTDVWNILVDKYGTSNLIPSGTFYGIKNKIKLPKEAFEVNPSDTHRIPILGYIAAGAPIYAEQHIEGYTHTELNGGGEYFALRVKGDSMNALRICDGDIIIVRRQSEVENGEIAVVLVDNENATVKQFYKDGESIMLIPKSTNPQHTPQFYNLKTSNITILGKVVRNQIDF